MERYVLGEIRSIGEKIILHGKNCVLIEIGSDFEEKSHQNLKYIRVNFCTFKNGVMCGLNHQLEWDFTDIPHYVIKKCSNFEKLTHTFQEK